MCFDSYRRCQFWDLVSNIQYLSSLIYILCSLFLYYINDIPTGLDSTIRLFADDTIAYMVIKSNSDAVITLQRDLDKLAQWEQIWKMAFHPDKCNVLTIHGIRHQWNSIIVFTVMSGNQLTRQNIWELPSARNSYGKTTSTTSVVKPIRLLVSCVATWKSVQPPLKNIYTNN